MEGVMKSVNEYKAKEESTKQAKIMRNKNHLEEMVKQGTTSGAQYAKTGVAVVKADE